MNYLEDMYDAVRMRKWCDDFQPLRSCIADRRGGEMIKDTISAVKEAEKQAAQTVSDAWTKSEELYRKSQKDAADIREQGRQDAHRVLADAHEAAVEKGRTDLADAEKKAEEEASELKKQAAPGTGKAVDAVVAALLE